METRTTSINTTVEKRIRPGYEPIEGYQLEQLIGRGGFGEVWQAKAPGGLRKAVKFVFGNRDERRAAQELKSLERIKGIQHPFILTLERFDFVDGRLVIVTELADRSLEETYQQQRERGSCGIPRDALLRYMRDAADALDYLHQRYKLQHLDVKPANLLNVGGHVKVADFGLLKDLGEIECSVVGGLTPIYAAPEVFDGRPSLHSDQYSLAVMYQELLTGVRPFNGRTIAQPATQHVHSAPNLEPLPACDRPCVARALEKSPERRFESCTDFVEKLLNPHGRISVDAEQEETQQELQQAREVENLPQIESADGDDLSGKQTHVLVVALGGSGSDCLHQMRSRVMEMGPASPMTLHSVLIDTDLLSTQTTAMIDATEFTPTCRTIHAPLRTAQEYREAGTGRLASISRRWIYNVPRNRATNGMRPLGRMALVDHGTELLGALRDAISELNEATTAETQTRVFVVGSLSGGTGSGTFIDVVHLLRHLLDEAAMEDQAVMPLLTTNRFQGDPSKPVALHSTKAALKELEYFLSPGNGYPGDIGAGWPSVPAARSPLRNTYVIANSTAQGAQSAIDCVVDYIWSDAIVCGRWFQEGRKQDESQIAPRAAIRSVGVVQLIDPNERRSNILAPHAVKSLLERWFGKKAGTEERAAEYVKRARRRCHLEPHPLRVQTEQLIAKTEQQRRERFADELRTLPPSKVRNVDELKLHLIGWIGNNLDSEQIEILVEQIVEQTDREARLRLQDGRLDITSTIIGIEELKAHSLQLSTGLQKANEHGLQLIDALKSLDDFEEHDPSGELSESGLNRLVDSGCKLAEEILEVIACGFSAVIATKVAERLTRLIDQYSQAAAEIDQLIRYVGQESGWTKDPWQGMDEAIQKQKPDILDRLHSQSVSKWLFGLLKSPELFAGDVFLSEIQAKATTIIQNAIGDLSEQTSDSKASTVPQAPNRNPSSDERHGSDSPMNDTSHSSPISRSSRFLTHAITETNLWSHENDEPQPLEIEEALMAVRPPLLDCGGQQRLYLVCRDKAEQTRFEEQLSDVDDLVFTPILARTAVPMLIHEGQNIELRHIIDWLDTLTGDDGKICERLVSRSDVQWK